MNTITVFEPKVPNTVKIPEVFKNLNFTEKDIAKIRFILTFYKPAPNVKTREVNQPPRFYYQGITLARIHNLTKNKEISKLQSFRLRMNGVIERIKGFISNKGIEPEIRIPIKRKLMEDIYVLFQEFGVLLPKKQGI